ncbi:hypothetical protein M1146_05620 [Patescibacteria group bacterium]|nr:hypothetical protein [Patescibacteria group bacterium]
MTNIETYAIDELTRIGMYGSGDEMNDAMCEHILKMVNVFAEEGHSGFSANYAISILQKLLRFEPLSPLTGEDDEWNEVGDGHYQNKRFSRVFKEGKDGQAYDMQGKVFVEPNGASYTSRDSHVYIEFPYVPHTEYVKVEKTEEGVW